MNSAEMHVVNGFTYHVNAIQESNERFRGQIYIFSRKDTGEFFTPPKIIFTPVTFKTLRAAIIEADAYCCEIMLNGDLNGFLEVAQSHVAKTDDCIR